MAVMACWSSSSSSWADSGLSCDFEDQHCRWQWSRFVRKSAAEINATIFSAPDPTMISGPLDDADGRLSGKHRNPPSCHGFLNRSRALLFGVGGCCCVKKKVKVRRVVSRNGRGGESILRRADGSGPLPLCCFSLKCQTPPPAPSSRAPLPIIRATRLYQPTKPVDSIPSAFYFRSPKDNFASPRHRSR